LEPLLAKKLACLCPDSKFPLPKTLFKCLNNILALLFQSLASDSIVSTCNASMFFLVSIRKPFSTATGEKASFCFL
jgi:hypothetical protein